MIGKEEVIEKRERLLKEKISDFEKNQKNLVDMKSKVIEKEKKNKELEKELRHFNELSEIQKDSIEKTKRLLEFMTKVLERI